MKHADQLAIYNFVKVAGLADYKPFNTDNPAQNAMYGAGAGALAGMGVQGLRHLISGSDGTDNSSLLRKLLKGALVGGTAGAVTPMLAGAIGPAIGGQIGKQQMLANSGIDEYKNVFNEAQYNTAKDTIASAGKHYGRAATEEMTMRDLASMLLNRDQ